VGYAVFGLFWGSWAACLPAIQRATAEEAFYKGKTLTIVVGYSAGGGYDQYARLVARHLRSLSARPGPRLLFLNAR